MVISYVPGKFVSSFPFSQCVFQSCQLGGENSLQILQIFLNTEKYDELYLKQKYLHPPNLLFPKIAILE